MQLISLDASPSSDLLWEDPSHEGIFFLDFGPAFFDETKFHAHLLAVEEFVKRFPHANEVILARTNGHDASQLLSEYLHRLASALPDDIKPILLCDLSNEQKIEDLILPLCRRRFEHFQLLFSHRKIPIEGNESIIVMLPQDEKYDPSIFGAIFKSLEGWKYKCIPEELLNEYWEGVDILIVEPTSLGEIGKRMILGFEAAGGKIEYTKKGAKSIDLALLSE